MKYWKKSNGDCGTMDSDGHVPDSVEIMKAEYDRWVTSIVITPDQIEEQRQANIKTEIAKTYSLTDEISIARDALAILLPDNVDVQLWNSVVVAAKAKYPNKEDK